MSYSKTLDYLYALKNRGSRYGIDRMRKLVDALGHPQNKFPLIHVAGTNGKGSVCAMLEALYRGNGYKTGFFSSPHLVHLGERAQVNREILSADAITSFTEQLKPIAAKLGKEDPELHPTFFEFITAMAFMRFAAESVDIACIETGLGGRLDATNVVDPELSIITTISLDHTEMLGETLAQIASEKAGIIKPGKPTLIGKLPPEAEVVVRQVAEQRGSKLFSLLDRFPDVASLPETNLNGDYQRWNAALAVYATEILAERYPVRFKDSLQQINWAGRWQVLEISGRKLILDATHNPEGVEALDRNLAALVESEGRAPIIVAGTLGEDRARSLMKTIDRYAREIHLVVPKQDRATPQEFMQSCLQSGATSTEVERIFPKAKTLTLGQPGDTIVITGSIYLIGEVMERIEGGDSAGGSGLNDKV